MRHDQEIDKITGQANPFAQANTTKRNKQYQDGTLHIKKNSSTDDPLNSLKKGLLMGSYRNSPVDTQQTNASQAVISGPDQSFLKKVGQYAGAQRVGNRKGHNSVLDQNSPTDAIQSFTGPSSICESYKNVDFFAVQEPYAVLKNRHGLQGL